MKKGRLLAMTFVLTTLVLCLAAGPALAGFVLGDTGSFTVEFWMNIPAANVICNATGGAQYGNNQVIVGLYDTGANWWAGLNCYDNSGAALPSPTVSFYSHSSTGDEHELDTTGVVANDGKWHHIAIVRTPVQEVIYVDGVQNTNTLMYNFGGSFASSKDINIGYWDYPSAEKFTYKGELDDLAIYDSALDQPTIQSHFNSQKGYCGGTTCPSSMQAYWSFDEATSPYQNQISGGAPATATIVPASVAGPSAALGNALSFNGTNLINVANPNQVASSGPGACTLVSPTNGQTGVDPTSVILSWNGVSGATSYNLYLGTDPSSLQSVGTKTAMNSTVTRYAGFMGVGYGMLLFGGRRKRTWLLVALVVITGLLLLSCGGGGSSSTPASSTPSGNSTTPSGTTPSSTTPSGNTPSTTTPSGNTPSTGQYSLTQSALKSATVYYWRVDSVNASGTTTGTVWSFTTK
jgi:hypothetical protein